MNALSVPRVVNRGTLEIAAQTYKHKCIFVKMAVDLITWFGLMDEV